MQRALYSHLEQETFMNSNAITSVSQANLHYLNQYHLHQHEGEVIGNGVDTLFFKASSAPPPKVKNIIFIGRLTWEKGATRFLECAEQVASKFSDVKFFFAGEGHLREFLEQRARQAGLQKQIICLGRLSRLALLQLYQNAYLQIIPSIYEGLPNVLLEGMSVGVPVIATAVGGIPEVITSGSNGLLIQQSQVRFLADYVTELIEDPPYRDRLSEAARQTIRTRFTWENVAKRLTKCYFDIL
jgi:glycosyltransferase involved in cell wall biosynthesis